MCKRDIYEIFIKLFGFLFILLLIEKSEDIVASVIFHFELINFNVENLIEGSVLILLFVVLYFLFFKTRKIANFISQSSDKEILQLPLDKRKFSEICFVIFGICIVIYSFVITLFLYRLEYIYYAKSFAEFLEGIYYLLHSLIPIILGILLIRFSVKLSHYVSQTNDTIPQFSTAKKQKSPLNNKKMYEVIFVILGILGIFSAFSEIFEKIGYFIKTIFFDGEFVFFKVFFYWLEPIPKIVIGFLLIKFSVKLSDYVEKIIIKNKIKK